MKSNKSLVNHFIVTIILFFCCFSAAAQCNQSYTLSPSGYVCATTTFSIVMSGSQLNVTYQLGGVAGNVGSPVAGTGSAITWSNVPLLTGEYLIYATGNGCTSVIVASAPLLTVPLITGTISASSTSICAGSPVILTANVPPASGRTTVVYQWFNHQGPPITGQTAQTFTTSTPGTYDVLVSSNCGSAMVPGPVLTTSTPTAAPGPVTGPATVQQITAQTSYTITASSNATSYSWSLSNPSAGTISGTGTTGTVTWNSAFSGPVTINASANGSCGGTAATGLPVTVYPQLAAGTISPASQGINYNITPSAISATATGGNGTITYQWQSSSTGTSGWANVSTGTGATTSVYTPAALTATTYYHEIATSNGVSVTSGTATVTVYPQLLAGTISPTSQSINYNTTPSAISATATGGNGTITYQWQSSATGTSGWTNVSTGTGGTTSVYTPAALTATTYYHEIATSNGVSVTSGTATVTVYPHLIAGTISPASQGINYNTTPTAISATATGGNGTITYQWQSSATGTSGWTNVTTGTGGTTSVYTPAALTATTYYHEIATSNGVSVTTGTATVTVYAQFVAGTVSPASQSINYNTTPTAISATATGGNGTITYQWQSSATGTSGWTNVTTGTGGTTSVYTPAALTATTYYHEIATSNGVSVTTGTATVTVYAQFVAGTVSPASQSINYNTTPTAISATATGGNGAITYQWQSSATGTSGWTNVSTGTGATTSVYAPVALTVTTYYHEIATSNGLSITSGTATVTVYPHLIAGTISPASQGINYNTAPSAISATATGGNGTITYQWQKSATGTGSWTNVSTGTGGTTSVYTPAPLTATTYYHEIATSNGVSVTSGTATVTVYPQLVASTISPASQTIFPGTTVVTNLTASLPTGGNGTFSYQWQSSPDGTIWTSITGAISSTYNPNPNSNPIESVQYYRLQVTSNGVTVNSNTAVIQLSECLPLGTMASMNINNIVISTPRIAGITNLFGLQNQTMCTMMQTVEYFDGLGRPLQTIQVGASPDENDVVQPYIYDRFDRDSVNYMPYASDTPTPGAYQPTAVSGTSNYNTTTQFQFYQQSGQGYVNTPYPFAGINYEASPLNRVIEQAAPGSAWQLSTGGVTGGGHTAKITYTNNDQSTLSTTPGATNLGCRKAALYEATINSDETRALTRAGNNATYASGELRVKIATDENWTTNSGCLNTTETYQDMEGHIVLKRTYNLKNGSVEMLSTYYVYDDRGNLCYVLPPVGSPDAAAAISQTTLDNLCYQYRYDGRNRLTQKKLPGKGWEFIIYNQLDQPVMTQDANQRSQTPQQWTFTKYDGRGNVVMTGQYTYTGTTADINMSLPVQTWRQTLENQLATTASPNWETTSTTTATGYTNQANPVVAGNAYFAINYYDGYAAPGMPAAYSAPASKSLMIQGLLTASKTAVLNTINITQPDMLWKVPYYDDLGRTIQTYSQHYLGGTLNSSNFDKTAISYDFDNNIISATRLHYSVAGGITPVVTIYDNFTYDQVNRKRQTWEQINNGTNILLSQLDYNEIGQLLTKHLHSNNTGTSFYQDIDYSYNERGWMLGNSASLFQEQLQYNNNTLALGNFTPQYNGNIGSQTRTAGATPTTTSYTYLYDNLNRLSSGTSTDNYNEAGITYDQAGNVQKLQRTWGSAALIDNLTYAYTNGGNYTNQVQSIADASADVSGKGYPTGTFTYQYDMNGNLKLDNSKSLSINAYNVANLPQNITQSGASITFTYDAGGRKLRKVSTAGAGTTTDYIDGIEYDGGVLTFIQTDEGRALYNGGAINYEYDLTDHLGDERITFDTHTITPTQVQQDDYYPFGYEISRGTTTFPKNEYLYNRKELQEDLQLYDYGARFYDPVIVRWTSVDELAEKYSALSPFVYVADNPIKNTDSDGRKIIFAAGTSAQFKKQFAQAVKFMNAHHTSGKLASLQKSSKIYTIAETKNPYDDDYQPKTRTINWDPNQALETTNGHSLSPATILGHEADHANQDDKHHDQFEKDANTPDAQYTDKEEKRVITGSEQTTAKAHGDIGSGEVTRTDHKGKFDLVPVSRPGSNGEIKIIAHKKKNHKNGAN